MVTNNHRLTELSTSKAPAIKQALQDLGAIGHANAVPRDIVLQHAQQLSECGRIKIREVRAIGNLCRQPDTLRSNPSLSIFYCDKGIYLPHSDPARLIEDVKVFRQNLLQKIGDMPEQLDAVDSFLKSASKNQSELFPEELDKAKHNHRMREAS